MHTRNTRLSLGAVALFVAAMGVAPDYAAQRGSHGAFKHRLQA